MSPTDLPPWPTLLAMAQAEVAATVRALPPDLRKHAQSLPVTYEPIPNEELAEDGMEEDLLGLFVGEEMAAIGTSLNPIPAQILLFLENIWDYSDADTERYREEIRATYLHELGHYLGLDEDDLEERGLG